MSESVLQGYPKDKPLGEGEFSLDERGMALFCTNGRTYQLHRCQVSRISCSMMKLSGMEEDGFDKTGRQKFKYQEWYVRFLPSPVNP
jgi:hypothetical protein